VRPYPKIDTLYRRDDSHRLTSELRHPYVIGDIARWVVEEKLDGQNLRLIYDLRYQGLNPEDVNPPELRGRSDAATLNPNVVNDVLANAPTVQAILDTFFPDGSPDVVTLYGEGIGPTIAGAGAKNRYHLDYHEFVLFDVKIGTQPITGWRYPKAVQEVAPRLGLRAAPVLWDGEPQELSRIVGRVRHGFDSRYAYEDDGMLVRIQAEGIVAKPRALFYDNRGRRVMLKLKTEDFS